MFSVLFINVPDGEAPPSLNFWDICNPVYNYPEWVDPNNVVYCLVDDVAGTFPFRSIFRKPVYHPLHPTFRLCPNFPKVYIDKTGKLLDEQTFDKIEFSEKARLGDYLIVPVPGNYFPQSVSRLRIYADAWKPISGNYVTHHYPVTINGKDRDLRPENIRYRPRFDNFPSYSRNQRHTERIPANWFTPATMTVDDLSDRLYAYESTRSRDVALWWDGPYGYFRYNLNGNNRDMCYNAFWCCLIVDVKDKVISTAYSMDQVITVSGYTLTRHAIRRLLKNRSDRCIRFSSGWMRRRIGEVL